LRDSLRKLWARYLGLRRHQQISIVVIIVVVGIGAAVATINPVRQKAEAIDTGPRVRPPISVRRELEKRFAPVVALDSKEPFIPIGIDSYVSATSLDERRGKGLRILQPDPTLLTLPTTDVECFAAIRCMYQLDVRGAEPPGSKPAVYGAINRQLIERGATATVYANVLQYTNTGDYSIQYWFLYLFNDGPNKHESDWEQITILLDKDKNPKEALYSSHATGFTRKWEEMEHQGDHPVVYVARGSHANYFHAGSHAVTVLCKKFFKRFHFCVEKRDIRDKGDGQGTNFIPDLTYEVHEFSPPVYIGSYGTGNYVAGHRANDLLSDPRLRSAYRNPLARLEKGTELEGTY
jgi:hypothetical protein